jgi:hypothetical protein
MSRANGHIVTIYIFPQAFEVIKLDVDISIKWPRYCDVCENDLKVMVIALIC